MKKKVIKIGVDFDGVVAYNPFRLIRAPVSFIKKRFLKVKKLKFYVPQKEWQKIFWIVVHESSVYPALGIRRLKRMSRSEKYEFHIITARFHFLDKSLMRWLTRFRMKKYFTGINLNVRDSQPHLHKLEKLNELNLDYFIEDNWDIVKYLNGRTKTKIFWIYNILDRKKEYPYKFPYLRKALEEIERRER